MQSCYIINICIVIKDILNITSCWCSGLILCYQLSCIMHYMTGVFRNVYVKCAIIIYHMLTVYLKLWSLRQVEASLIWMCYFVNNLETWCLYILTHFPWRNVYLIFILFIINYFCEICVIFQYYIIKVDNSQCHALTCPLFMMNESPDYIRQMSINYQYNENVLKWEELWQNSFHQDN